MNTKNIFNILKNVFSIEKKFLTLGRWNIHNNTQTILKIKYANVDNCGISGNYLELQQKYKTHEQKYIKF